MKRRIVSFSVVFAIVGIFVFVVFACNNRYSFDYEDMKKKVVKVEIVYHNYDSSRKLIKELTDDEIDEFLKGLSEIKFKHVYGAPAATVGYNFAIYYKNNDSELLSAGGTSYYQHGKLTGGKNIYCSKESFNNLLSKFIEIEQ